MIRKQSATVVTGSSGYLGAAVMSLAGQTGPLLPVRRELGVLESLVDAHRAVACHGALRGASSGELEAANVDFTRGLLGRLPSGTPIAFASTRFCTVSMDPYGRSKQAAERLIAEHSPQALVIRFCVLAGPSPQGLGRSFITRMAQQALYEGIVTVPDRPRPLAFLDVSQAASALLRLPVSDDSGIIVVAPRPVSSDDLAELLVETTFDVVGRKPKVIRRQFPDPEVQSSESCDNWQTLCDEAGVAPIAAKTTVRATLNALAGVR